MIAIVTYTLRRRKFRRHPQGHEKWAESWSVDLPPPTRQDGGSRWSRCSLFNRQDGAHRTAESCQLSHDTDTWM